MKFSALSGHRAHTSLLQITVVGLLFVSVVFASISAFLQSSANAASLANWNAGRIIDDAVMVNKNSMGVKEIQSFLNSKVPTCDTNGQQLSEYGGPDLNGDGKVQRWEWGKANYNQTTFPCLKDYKDPSTGLSSAQTIYNAAQKYSINPQVLIVLLQKEQGLVTDTWPLNIQYRSATGYGCPDTAACDSQYYGLTNQLSWAATMYHAIETDSPTWYTPYVLGNNYIQYNPSSSCGGSTVNIQNRATQALYNYTPYQPNRAALAAGYGSGDSCSASGNRNFYLYFTDWFGSTYFPQPVGGMLYRQSSTGKIFLVTVDNNTRYYIPSPSIMSNYGLGSYPAIAASDTLINSYTDGGSLSNLVNDNGDIYLVNGGHKNYVSSPSVCTNWAFDCFNTNVTKSLGATFIESFLKSETPLNSTALYNGTYYSLQSGVRLPYADKNSFTSAGNSTTAAAKVNNLAMTQPLGKLQLKTPGVIRFSPKRTIYYFNGTGYYQVPGMDVYNNLHLGLLHTIVAPESSYNTTEDVPVAGTLGYWYQASDGTKYVINDGQKVPLTAAQANLWPTADYLTGVDPLLSSLPSGKLGDFIKSGINFYRLLPEIGEKRYIAGMADYIDLGGTSSNTTHLSTPLSDSIKSGPFAFADGRLIKVQGDTTIYVMNEGKLLHVASMSVLNAYHFDASKMKVYPVAGVNAYEQAGQLQIGKLSNGDVVIPSERKLVTIPAASVSEWGFNTANASDISDGITRLATQVPATQFWRDSTNGRIYYGSGGALHYVSSMGSYRTLGGTSTPLTSVDGSIIDMFTQGAAK